MEPGCIAKKLKNLDFRVQPSKMKLFIISKNRFLNGKKIFPIMKQMTHLQVTLTLKQLKI